MRPPLPLVDCEPRGNMRRPILFIFIQIVVSFDAFASENLRPVALQIYLYDEGAIVKAEDELMETLYRDALPNIRFERVSVSLNQPSDQIRDQLLAAIRRIRITSSEKISHLIIDGHGVTERSGDELVTRLTGLGAISDSSVDREFAEVFEPLKPHFSKNLKILFNACLVFCGPEADAQERATSLLRYFGAPNGEVYGSNVEEVSIAFEKLSEAPVKYFMPSKKIWGAALVLTAAVGIGWHLDPVTSLSLGENIFYGAGALVANALGMNAVRIGYQKFAARFFLNRGWVFRLKNNQVVQKIKITKKRYLDGLLGRCETSLLGSTK